MNINLLKSSGNKIIVESTLVSSWIYVISSKLYVCMCVCVRTSVCVCVYLCARLCVYTAHLCKGTFIPDEQISTVSVHRDDHEMLLPLPD